MRAFIDTNVIVDVVAKREPFFADSQAVLALCATGDLEDAVQLEAARTNLVDVIITRNVRHFHNSSIRVCTPSEFLVEETEQSS